MSKYLVFIVIDGVRYSEAFGTPANIPNIMALAAGGSILTELYGDPNPAGLTSTCPGHAALLSGKFEALPNDGSQSPDFPSFFQEWLYQNGIRSNPVDGFTDRAKIILSKDKLYMLGTNVMAGPYQDYRPYVNAGVNGDGTGGYRADALTHALFKTQCLGANPPIISMVGYAEADTAAHAHNWAGYNTAIQTADGYVGEIVSLVNAHPLMAGNTYFVITTDHGRQVNPNYWDHGGSTLSERHAFFVANGPKIRVGFTSGTTHASIDAARTALALLDLTKQYTVGVLIPEIIISEYFTQSFTPADPLDLANQSFTFSPDGSGEYYLCCKEYVSQFFVTPTDETDLVLPSDSYIEIILPTSTTIPFYGTRYDKFYIGSNGYVTFGSGDTSHTPTLANHFDRPRISGAFSDFGSLGGTSYGSIYFVEMTDRIAITWKDMLHFPGGGESTNPTDFQIELFFDGRIRLTYLRAAAITCIVGLSRGNGVPADFTESSFSSYNIMPVAPSDLTAGGMTVDKVRLQWVDNSDFDVAFVVERKSGGSWSEVATIQSGEAVGLQYSRQITYVDSDLLPGSQYTYRVFALNSDCASDPSNEATATTRPEPIPPLPPTPVDFEIHPIRQDEKDQLQIGTSLSMRQKNRQWNAQVGSVWSIVKIVEGKPRKITLRPIEPNHTESLWTLREDQLREHFDMQLDIPGPPPQMRHL